MTDIRTPIDRGVGGYDNSEGFYGPILGDGEEADLIRAAKAGCPVAKDKLARSFRRLILTIAAEYYGPSRDDLIDAGELGLWEGVLRYDLRRNNRFGVYAEHSIRKRMRLAVREWRKGGQAGETRIDRWLHDNPNATLDDIINKFGCVRRKALEALNQRERTGTATIATSKSSATRTTILSACSWPIHPSCTGCTTATAVLSYRHSYRASIASAAGLMNWGLGTTGKPLAFCGGWAGAVTPTN